VFVQPPSDAYAGTAITPTVAVQVQDQYGNASSTNGVVVTLAPSAGTIDAGATATTSSAGLATFSGLKINTAALGLTLHASATGLATSAASASFNVTVLVSNGATLTDTAADAGSGVRSVSYYYCTGYSGSCTSTNWTTISGSTNAAGSFPATWTVQPANGAYRLVAVGSDNVNNTSAASPTIPVTVAN
jgi:hypothetical protein